MEKLFFLRINVHVVVTSPSIDLLHELKTSEHVYAVSGQKLDFFDKSVKAELASKQRDPLTYLDAKISEMQESIPDKIIKASDSINQKNGLDQLKSNSLSYSIIIGSIVNIYGNCVRREFQIEDMTTIYEYVYTFFYRLGFNCICSFVISSPKAEQLECGVENYLAMLRKYNLSSGVEELIRQVIVTVQLFLDRNY